MQLARTPRPFPQVRLREGITDIDGFTAEDIELLDYHPHPKVEMAMAV